MDLVHEGRHPSRIRAWFWSWIGLTAALALHVVDEAATDFLSMYNPAVLAIRSRLPFLPLPTFTFGVWLSGLAVAVVILAALSLLVYRGNRHLRVPAYLYAVIMGLNGISHMAASVYLGRPAPGLRSSPLLLIASVALLMTTFQLRRASRVSSDM